MKFNWKILKELWPIFFAIMTLYVTNQLQPLKAQITLAFNEIDHAIEATAELKEFFKEELQGIKEELRRLNDNLDEKANSQ